MAANASRAYGAKWQKKTSGKKIQPKICSKYQFFPFYEINLSWKILMSLFVDHETAGRYY